MDYLMIFNLDEAEVNSALKTLKGLCQQQLIADGTSKLELQICAVAPAEGPLETPLHVVEMT